MDPDLKRRQVNYDQLNALLEFLKEHQELAKGLTRGRRGKLHTLKLWNQCAKKLNVIRDGASKDGKGWSKYWCDWKYRVRRRALELKAAKESNRSPPDGVSPLSLMEESILGIIGENAVDGVVIKSDPLAEGDTDEEEPDNEHKDVSVNQYYGTRSRLRSGQKRRHSVKDLSELEDHGGPSSPPERKSRTNNAEIGDSDDTDDDDTSEFLRLEREKLENSKKVLTSIQSIATEITRLADVMSHIRDVLINNRINI